MHFYHEMFTWTQWHHCFGNFPFFYPMKYIPWWQLNRITATTFEAQYHSVHESQGANGSRSDSANCRKSAHKRLADYIARVAYMQLYCGFELNWMFPLSALGQNSSCSPFSHFKDLPNNSCLQMRCFRNVVVLWYICGIRCCIDFVTP